MSASRAAVLTVIILAMWGLTIWLCSANLASGWWTSARVHRLEGIAVYFAGLMVLDLVARRCVQPGPPRPCGAR